MDIRSAYYKQLDMFNGFKEEDPQEIIKLGYYI